MKLNEPVIEALVRLFDQENKFVLANPVLFRKKFVEATKRWTSAVAPHRNPDGSIRVFVEEGDPTPAPTHYTVDGHMLEIVVEPVTIDGERVDVVKCERGFDIVRRGGNQHFWATQQRWSDGNFAPQEGCYLTAAAAIADRAELARRAGGAE